MLGRNRGIPICYSRPGAERLSLPCGHYFEGGEDIKRNGAKSGKGRPPKPERKGMKEGWSGFQTQALLASFFYRALTVALLAVALARQRRFKAFLLARLQIERVALDFFDDVLLQNLALEAPERVLKGFTILNVDLGQVSPLHGK